MQAPAGIRAWFMWLHINDDGTRAKPALSALTCKVAIRYPLDSGNG